MSTSGYGNNGYGGYYGDPLYGGPVYGGPFYGGPSGIGFEYGTSRAADLIGIFSGAFLTVVAVGFFVQLWYISNVYKRKGLKQSTLATFICIHIPLLFVWIFEFVACFLRIDSFSGKSISVRKSEFSLRFASLAFLEVFVIAQFIYLLLLAKRVRKLRDETPDENASSSLGKTFKNVVWQFGIVLYGQLFFIVVLIVRLVNVQLINEGGYVESVFSELEQWLLFPEAVSILFFFVLLILANWLSSPLKAEFELVSKEEPAAEVAKGVETAEDGV